eukprot:TRINITY_DN97_c0_g1_i3.p1 TRINITY_DN97_c0_g1~~TRINITY_DN97_c0_g1_i3.p1  ORF type:complete len:582 (+),score=82.59 TRINITY_DN97_c0_g1_i3:1405-3150(+)
MTVSLSPTNPALSNLSEHDQLRFCQFSVGQTLAPSHSTVISAIQHAFKLYPNSIAAHMVQPDGCLHPTHQITYETLRKRANLVSATLIARGVTPGESVCLFLSRGLDMLVAIVATLQVAASYVPQDARIAPHAQLLRVAAATAARVVLTTHEHASKLPSFPNAVKLAVSTAENEGRNLPPFTRPPRPVRPTDTCYIIFTSGTTGAPKGVQVTHANVVNVLLTDPMSLCMRNGARVSQILSIAFDMCAWEVLGCLSHGATLVIRGRNISDAIRHAQIVISTPTVLGTIDSSTMHHVETVAVAGEPCPRALADEWSTFCTFYNSCGPTEVTIINTAKKHTVHESRLTIGKPTPNNTVYVLDRETRKPCRIGDVGEMWAGGKCVSKGYLNNVDLTNERFVPDPFVGGEDPRMYRTGDLGRWTHDGELEHYGRVDDQVKVKGFRVELDGVSSIVENTVGVKKAVVLKWKDSLVAFVTPANISAETVIGTVRAHVPYYCVPSKVVCMEELPRTGNGKVDKRALLSGLKCVTDADERSVTKHVVNMATNVKAQKPVSLSPIMQRALRAIVDITAFVRYFIAVVRNLR